MTSELFTNIPDEVKERTKLIADFALTQLSLPNAIKMLAQYANTCYDEEEQNYVDFYFNMRLELLKENA